MNADQNHRMLVGIDGVLDIFKEAEGKLNAEETELKFQLSLMRAHVLRAESGHPFPSRPPSQAASPSMEESDITRAPWQH